MLENELSIFQIITYGNPILRKKAKKIKNIDKEIELIEQEIIEAYN